MRGIVADNLLQYSRCCYPESWLAKDMKIQLTPLIHQYNAYSNTVTFIIIHQSWIIKWVFQSPNHIGILVPKNEFDQSWLNRLCFKIKLNFRMLSL